MSLVSANNPRLLLFCAALCCLNVHAATVAPDRTEYPDSIKTVPAAPTGVRHAAAVSRTVLSAAENAASMTFEVALRMRNFDEMQARIARGERMSGSEKTVRYFPLSADHERLVQWLTAQGLEITRTDDNHLAVFGRGSVDAVARAFGVTFARVAVEGDGEYTSAVTAPSLPTDLSPIVLGIHGLQPHIKRHALIAPRAARLKVQLDGYSPAQIATAYNATSLSVTGAGETIAIYALAFPEQSDLTQFWTAFGISQSAANIVQVPVAGGPASSPDQDSADEVALDVEWASALAPGARIRIYGANENDPAENDEILQQVYADLPTQPSMHVLNICIGGNELDVPKDYLILEAQYMANLASAGVTVLSASGDNGAIAEGVVQTTYPTSDPDVTGVGGTTLILNSDNSVQSETAWATSPSDGSGGGVSVAFSRPSWQVGLGIGTNTPSTTMRLVPDVAGPADPNYGGEVYVGGQLMTIGGTSWATPIWSAFCALIDQKRGTPLGLLNPLIYPLLGAPTYSSSFRDITQGSNGTYSAGVGYDLLTGIGVPVVSGLLADPLTSTPSVSIAGQLGSRVVTLGQPALFYVVGAGTLPLSFQWQRLPYGSTAWADVTDGGAYSGSETQGLLVSGTTSPMSGDQFRCTVTNATGSVTSQPATLTVNAYGVTTLAGWPGSGGHADGTGWNARFSSPGGVRADGNGNIFVSDASNDTIRKVTTAGVVTTVAGTPGTSGSTDGPVASALFNGVAGVAPDSAGNLYVADDGNFTIRKISTAGVVSTLAGVAGMQGETDGTGAQARFYDPQNLAVDGAGNVYVADGMGQVIRKVTPAGVVTTIAGTARVSGSSDGTGAAALFNYPTGIAVDGSGNIYVADQNNDTVRKITPAGVVTTLAGQPGVAGSSDGTGSAAAFNLPAGVGVDNAGNLFVADEANCTIREINPSGFVTTVAGAAGDAGGVDGLPGNARFYDPGDVTIDPAGIIYVADSGNCTIRRVISGSGTIPDITQQPTDEYAVVGGSATFSVTASGSSPISYQWYFNGTPIAGATGSSYTVTSVQASDSGQYSVTATNSNGTVTSIAGNLYISAGTSGARLINISTRALVGTGANIVIPGFVIGGSGTETLLIRADGPALAAFGVTGALASPTLVVTAQSTGATLATNTGWGTNSNAAQIASLAAQVGAFALASGSADCAVLVNLQPGAYTVQVSGVGGTTGVALAEIYEVSSTGTARLINIATRAQVGTGGNILIPGFVIGGTGVEELLVRADGPSLTSFGVTGVLAQPSLTVTAQSTGQSIGSNTGWGTNANPSQVASIAASVGAFAFASGSADSALVVNLAPGAYTMQITGVDATTGVALAEVYEVP
jgi:hypothetical protein